MWAQYSRKRAQRHFECYYKEEDYTLSKEKSTVKRPEKLASSISSEIGKKISAETVRRVLHNAGFHGRIPQDNDQTHTAKIVKLYLLYHCKKELHTPPQSPDLNVIENLWSQLEKSVHEHAITTKEDIKNILKKSGPKSQWKSPKN
ncbi:hypothetical protein TNCV_2758091 [Trichonephila clavipes]|nr:hypothetical protein TNCV_2758091 [Trichonephila clavipes]